MTAHAHMWQHVDMLGVIPVQIWVRNEAETSVDKTGARGLMYPALLVFMHSRGYVSLNDRIVRRSMRFARLRVRRSAGAVFGTSI